MSTYTPQQRLFITDQELNDLDVRAMRAKLTDGKMYRDYGNPPLTGTDLAFMRTEDVREFIRTGIVLDSYRASNRPAKTETPQAQGDDKAQALIKALQDALNAKGTDLATINDLLDAKIATLRESLSERRIVHEIRTERGVKELTSAQHYKFPLVLKAIASGVNVALVGPAGTGKSTMVQVAAEALGLEYSPISFNILSSKADVLGFKDANGVYHASAFRERFEHGGVFLADEFDAAHAGIATILNAAIANRLCTFADNQTIKAHKDFIFVAVMNTYGTGATAQHTGRNRLDGATLDRFFYIYIDHDDYLEACATNTNSVKARSFAVDQGGSVSADEWVATVRAAREIAKQKSISCVISQRASLMGVALAAQGIGKRHLVDGLLVRGLSETDAKNLSGAL